MALKEATPPPLLVFLFPLAKAPEWNGVGGVELGVGGDGLPSYKLRN